MANLRRMEELRMGRYFEQDQHALRSVTWLLSVAIW